MSDFNAASCSLYESINLFDNSNDDNSYDDNFNDDHSNDDNSNHDNDNHIKRCQTENRVLAESCFQTDLDIAQLDRGQIDMQHITDELNNTKGQLLSTQLAEHCFGDDDKTKFYTGIPSFSLLMNGLNLIAPHIKRNTQNAPCQFQEFL